MTTPCENCANKNCTQSESEIANCEKWRIFCPNCQIYLEVLKDNFQQPYVHCAKCGFHRDLSNLPAPVPEDKREVIAWTVKNWLSRGYHTGSEFSEPTGFFRSAHATLTYQTEDPACECGGSSLPLNRVRIASPEQKQKYLEIHDEMEKLRADLKACEQDIAANGLPMPWEWILQHGKPRTDGWVPVPYRSKKRLANLRKGSRVVIAVQSSAYYQIAGKVGKVVKKRSKDVLVRYGTHQYTIPYPDLKPADQVSQKERESARLGSETSAKVCKAINEVLK